MMGKWIGEIIASILRALLEFVEGRIEDSQRVEVEKASAVKENEIEVNDAVGQVADERSNLDDPSDDAATIAARLRARKSGGGGSKDSA